MSFFKRFGKRLKDDTAETVDLSPPKSVSTRLPQVYDVTSGSPPIVSGTETRTIESPQEQVHRHRKEMLGLIHKLRKDWYVTIIFTFMSGTILVASAIVCVNIQNDKTATEDLKKAVLAGTFSLWTAAVSGTVGYLAGKGNSKNTES